MSKTADPSIFLILNGRLYCEDRNEKKQLGNITEAHIYLHCYIRLFSIVQIICLRAHKDLAVYMEGFIRGLKMNYTPFKLHCNDA